MWTILTCHPDTPCAVVTQMRAYAARTSSAILHLHYRIEGAVAAIAIPDPGKPERRDGLWQHSCFEAFLRAGDGAGYHEFNFAPSRSWAAYRFEGYRDGMAPALDVAEPVITLKASEQSFELKVSLDLHAPAHSAWRLGLSAVIEEKSGAKSYWALAHPPGKPDFHYSDCFVLQL